jgi:enamine deaminase RidA (YjgF/YER057c/UK114 family)
MTPEQSLSKLGIALPEPAAPVANYVPFSLAAGLLVVSGQLPMRDGKVAYVGKLGSSVTEEMGAMAAQLSMINVLAQARAALGELTRVRRVVRLGGFIACTPEFTRHAVVMNGASDLAVAVFGDAGRHARTTIGVPCLPADAAVEVEAMFEVA